jgi:hypothetical protein
MDKEKLPKLYKREWLNEDEGSAYFIIEAGVDEHWKWEDAVTLDASLQIKDCNRQIELEFYAGDEEEYRKRINKINLLIGALEELRQFMLDNPAKNGTIKKKKKEEDKVEVLNLTEYLERLEEESTDVGKADEAK